VGTVATVRDVAIIMLAIESLVIGILMVVLLFQIRSLIRLIQEEIRPLLNSANETMGTVRGTAAFMSDNMVTPGLKLMSFFSGARRTLEVLARLEDREE
jgi:hypothetical protein